MSKDLVRKNNFSLSLDPATAAINAAGEFLTAGANQLGEIRRTEVVEGARVQIAGIEAEREKFLGQMAVATQALRTVTAGFEVWKAHIGYKETVKKVEGEIRKAELKLDEARVALSKAQGDQENEMKRIATLSEWRAPLIESIRQMNEQLAEVKPDHPKYLEMNQARVNLAKVLAEMSNQKA